MNTIKKIKKQLNIFIKKNNLKRHISLKADRVVLYNLFSTVSNSMFAMIKITIGLVLWSLWFLIFGFYYLILLAIRAYFLFRYKQVRIANFSNLERRKLEEIYLREGGIFYSILGLVLVGLSTFMFVHGQPQNYNHNIVLFIALIGFIKIVTSVIGWINSRQFNSPIISYLKALNLADGLVAIVMTQYALLSYKHSEFASSSTGLFGICIGFVLIIVGIAISTRFFRKSLKKGA
ncbi:hypothetical protein [Fructobacillus americanaquae]|uniref:Uncharacterized protein n=1 Tax=Fructobacillus americanaquae TaxID=2940302 RepID=A0ABY5C1U6_9LACO|nr:hypothetical protein [Fructobacillus americanaquae]USS92153.1 hypothetical protein M3M36_00620 [Fructobacillus americanaquae]